MKVIETQANASISLLLFLKVEVSKKKKRMHCRHYEIGKMKISLYCLSQK